MKLLLQAQLLNIFKSNDFTDKKSGEVSKGKTKLQLLLKRDMKDSSVKQELLDISIPNEKLNLYKDKVGKEVSVDVGLMGEYRFYGV